ncbi:MAG: hypothetical protein K1X29_10570 [Bdellovibrionales bacterium]|nr:hypothetical protein [Bdellovibrionales bacterium]
MAKNESRSNLAQNEKISASKPTSSFDIKVDLENLDSEVTFEENHLDVVQQLNQNITQLEDLFGRLQFVLTEVKAVLPNRRIR